MYDISIIGYGVSAMCFLLVLCKKAKRPLRVIVFDPYCDGGLLRRDYPTVRSNTTWKQFLTVMKDYCSSELYLHLQNLQSEDEVTKLEDILSRFKKILHAALTSSSIHLTVRKEEVFEVKHDATNWIVNQSTPASLLIVTTGSVCSELNYQKPKIPLSKVLTGSFNLMVKPLESVVVIGTAHSGVLAIDALNCASMKVTAIYSGDRPFKYARDGEYDGIKQDAALIADNLSKEVKLINRNDTEAVQTAIETADWIVYACGFKPLNTIKCENGSLLDYDTTTGRLLNVPAAYGFGIAYPNSNTVNGNIYYDVSIPSFMKHIERNIHHIVCL
jgi:hypothetical protein